VQIIKISVITFAVKMHIQNIVTITWSHSLRILTLFYFAAPFTVSEPDLTYFDNMCTLRVQNRLWSSQQTDKAIVDNTSPAICLFFFIIVHSRHPLPSRSHLLRRGSEFCSGVTILAAIALQCIVNGAFTPFPTIGDAAYRKRARGGPIHGHRQHAEKIW